MSGVGALVKTAKAARKAEPFYSAADEAAKTIKRGSGTGQAFINELKKAGVKPAELKERKLAKLESMPKMTRDEFIKELESNPPPKFEEKTLVEPTKVEVEELAHQLAYDDAMDELRAEGMNRHEAADVAAEMAEDRVDNYIDEATEQLSLGGDAPYHSNLALKGGQNYREILLKMPSFKDEKKLMELEAMRRRVDPEFHSNRYNELTQQIDELKAQKAAMPEQFRGDSRHFGGEPGVLASIRVSDRVMPTYTKQQAQDIGQRIAEGMGVADPKNLGSGAISVAIKNGYVTPREAAQYADFRGFQGVDTAGAKQKVLHIEEIQSDWHQKGKDQGYKTSEIEARRKELEQLAAPYYDGNRPLPPELRKEIEALPPMTAVPDAPFKENWHELALKRMLNYAAENNYDRIAITPGATQADRYDLSKHIDSVYYAPQGQRLIATDKSGKTVLDKTYTKPEDLAEYIGKEASQKLLASQTPEGNYSLSNADLKVGGEGMRHFYDERVPSYLNKYGQPYGAQVNPFDIEIKPSEGFHVRDTENPESRPTRFMSATDAANWRRANNYPDTYVIEPQPAETSTLHGFDLTPEMREELLNRGLPLYKKGGEIKKRGRVHVSQNPDTMLLDLMSKS